MHSLRTPRRLPLRGRTRPSAPSRLVGPRLLCGLLALGALLLAPVRAAEACGVSGPDGAPLCVLAAGGGPKLRVGVAATGTSTRMTFEGTKLAQTRLGGAATLAATVGPRTTVQGSLGALAAGTLTLDRGDVFHFEPGLLAGVGVAHRLYGGPTVDAATGEAFERNPFVVASANLSALVTTTTRGRERAQGYEAFDLRGGLVVGATLAERFRPYALARGFGGPAYWRIDGRPVRGTDLYHVQVGAGLSVALGAGWVVAAEAVPLGERGLTASLSTTL